MIDFILRLIFLISTALILTLLTLIFIQKFHHRTKKRKIINAREYFYEIIKDIKPKTRKPERKLLFEAFFKLEDQIVLDLKTREKILKKIDARIYEKKFKRGLHSLSSYIRITSAINLGLLHSENAKKILISRLAKEKNNAVKFYISYSLFQTIDQFVFDKIIESALGEYYLYVKNIAILSNHFYAEIIPYIDKHIKSNRKEIVHIIAYLAKRQHSFDASSFVNRNLPYYLTNDNFTCELDISTKVALLDALQIRNSPLIKGPIILNSQNLMVRKYGYQALAKSKEIHDIKRLLSYLNGDIVHDNIIVEAITDSIESTKTFIELFSMVTTFNKPCQKNALAKILSAKTDHLILLLKTNQKSKIIKILELLVDENHAAGIIAFINGNKDIELEKMIFSVLALSLTKNKIAMTDFLTYIKPKILIRYDYLPIKPPITKKTPSPPEISKLRFIWITLFLALIFYPALSFIKQGLKVFNQNIFISFERFILDTNLNLIWYFVFANLIYLLLLLISLVGARKQNYLWSIKSEKLLYIEDLLPPISIIAPAYNEEASIITSIQSLLNLKYPSYEVIVVNDGSKDETLFKLITHFNLSRTNPAYEYSLKTKEIRGIYRTKEIPNLVVVDKLNGGKADALNVGINIARNPYICGIDADSVLEQEALLRLISVTLDKSNVPVALGGNIIPANGCKIEYGHIVEKALPTETLTRLQSLEYLRAFTTGRIGWASINSLLIISGAFGLFRKKDILKIGGYITSSGKLKKDSVGEDMELVVRITYNKIAAKERYLVDYIYHANCFTELPSDMKTLLKQRNRWHRGLIDIISYHRRMLLNPRYKQIGLIAFPYFYIFEILGPFFELFGYLALIISFIFGFLAAEIVFGIFLASVIMGTVISLTSLYISEEVTEYTKTKDVFILIFFSLLENFGYRQLVSMHRVYSFFTTIKDTGAWGEQKRKGFK